MARSGRLAERARAGGSPAAVEAAYPLHFRHPVVPVPESPSRDFSSWRLDAASGNQVRILCGSAVVSSAAGADRSEALLNLWSALIERGEDDGAAFVAREYRKLEKDGPGEDAGRVLADEQAARSVVERRRERPDRRQRTGSPQQMERRRTCGYCYQEGDHATPAQCLRALER